MTNPLFELKGGIVSVTKQGMLLSEIKELHASDKDKNKEFFHKVMSYVFNAYSKDSPYYDVLANERRSMVSKEVFGSVNEWKIIEKNKHVEDLIVKLAKIQVTAKERLLEGVNRKIEEYLEFMDNTKITTANHNEVASQIKNSNELLKLRDTIEKQVLEQKESRDVGGGTKKLFED
jgi:hypothetical protein